MQMYFRITLLPMLLILTGGVAFAGVTNASLEPLTLVLKERPPRSYERQPLGQPCGIAIQVKGTAVNRNVKDFSVERKFVYTDPLECCVAVLTAILNEDEKWYGALAASVDQRNLDGLPNDNYIPDSTENLYNLFTYYKVDDTAPRILNYELLYYIRVGGMHGFKVETTGEFRDEQYRITEMYTIQEFGNGFYRYASEWIYPNADHIVPVFGYADNETAEQKAYRLQFPERHHELLITGLYGDTQNEFPLKMFFRGGFAEDHPEYQQVTQNALRILDLLRSLNSTLNEEQYLQSDARKELATLFDNYSLDMLDRQGIATRASVSTPEKIFIIDGEDMYLAFMKDKNGDVGSDFDTFVRINGQIILTNYNYTGLLSKFLRDDRIQNIFYEELERIFKAN